MTLLVALLLLAATQQGPRPATEQRFEQVAKQAAQSSEQGNTGEAERLYREGVRLHPDWGEGWWYLGRLFYDRNSYEECRKAFQRFTEIEPKVGSGWAALGLCEYGTKSYDESRAHLERARSLGLEGNPQLQALTLYHAALLLTQSGEFEAALGILMRLAERGRETPALVEAAGMAGLGKALPPRELPPGERELVLQAGRAVMDAGARRQDEAHKEFESLVASYPKAPNIHYMYGSFLLSVDTEAALGELKKELEVSPRHVPALLQIAFEYLRQGDGAAALPYARRAAEINANSFGAHNALGRALVETGELEKGIQELELSKQEAPDTPQTHIALASAYAKAGRTEEAARERAEFRKLKELSKKPGEQ